MRSRHGFAHQHPSLGPASAISVHFFELAKLLRIQRLAYSPGRGALQRPGVRIAARPTSDSPSTLTVVRPFSGAWGGAVLAAVLCVAYDTSSNVSVIEGGRAHLTFRAILVLTAAGAAAGLIVGALAWASRIRAETARKVAEEQGQLVEPPRGRP
jgi:hypothetical protein